MTMTTRMQTGLRALGLRLARVAGLMAFVTVAFFVFGISEADAAAGLTGDYFNNLALTAPPAGTRVDANVNFNWGGGAPGVGGLGATNFSVRWRGRVLAPSTANYFFRTQANDGVRLWVNCTKMIDAWVDGPVAGSTQTTSAASIALTAGSWYDIELDYYQKTGADIAQLLWKVGAAAYVTVPAAQLDTGNTGACLGCVDNTSCSACAGTCQATNVCTLKANGTACRAAADVCDTAATCTGTSVVCPANGFKPASTVCRAAVAGGCDIAENCTGASAACPADVVVAAGTTCRGSAGVCDVAEVCTGLSGVCPVDAFLPNSTVCRPAVAGGCDIAENCTGASAACPADVVVAAGTTCRAAAGVCDVAEVCTGLSNACPADAFAPASTVCRGSAGACDVVENCTGASAGCPADAKLPVGTVCRLSTGSCDSAATCDGVANACPPNVLSPAGTSCRPSAGVCDVAEACTGASGVCPADTFLASGTACPTDNDDCTTDACSGAAAACSHTAIAGCTHGLKGDYYTNSTSFGALTLTRTDPTVNFDWGNGTPDPAISVDTFTVRWTGQVQAIETGTYTFETETDDGVRLWVNCSLLANQWVNQAPAKVSGTIALVAGQKYDIEMDYYENTGGASAKLRWTRPDGTYEIIPTTKLYPTGNAGTCRGGACTTNADCALCTTCNAGTHLCDLRANNTVCRASLGTCDQAEVCNGTSPFCPADLFSAAGVPCRPAVSVCDVPETCTGLSGVCPADTFAAAGIACADDSNVCTQDQCAGTDSLCHHTPIAGCNNGLKGDYYTNSMSYGALTLTRVDPTVNFDWGNGSPDPAVSTDSFTVRWTGQVQAVETGAYTFETETDDGARLWVNCNLLVNQWQNQGPTKVSGTINLVAGQKYDIEMDYYENTGGAVARLRWTRPNATYEIIPQAQLFSTGNTGTCRGGACTTDADCAACTTCNAGTHLCDPKANNTVCRVSTGPCDAAEACNGKSALCPADVVSAAGTVCRVAAGACDTPETCNGVSGACPADVFAAAGTACLDDGDVCTSDTCSGADGLCHHTAIAGCSRGLTATYYDNMDFTGPAVTRIDPTINFDWGNGTPDPAIGPDTFTVRWTGQVQAPETGTFTFESETDDGVRVWVNCVLLVDHWVNQGATKWSGTINLVAGQKYDIKVDYYENGGGASAKLRWTGPTTPYEIVPNAYLYPDGDKGTCGFEFGGGGATGTGYAYQIWRLSDVPNTAPVDATPESPNNWGLGNAVMMVPAFSPDGTKLVFVDGDSAAGNGWRKGVSVWDFNEAGKTFTNRRTVYGTAPLGNVLKWPVFESDSRTIIFQTSTPTELCTQCDGKTGARYGNMAPTNYYGTVGDLWSVDASGGTPVNLAKLNTGERADDAHKSYQPTVLPAPAGGYRWGVFTSTRPYGNILNPPGTTSGCYSSQLWISAIDDTTSNGADRSHPAFWLPNQNYGDPTQSSYINERGYWVLEQCKAASSACITNEDCCGSGDTPPTAACRIDQPVASPPTRHCVGFNPNVCSADGGSCSDDSNCCGFPLSHCVAGTCTPPRPLPMFTEASYTRDYEGICPAGTLPAWHFFDYIGATPGNSEIDIYAQTAETQADLGAATKVLVAVVKNLTVLPDFTGVDVAPILPNGSQHWLRITLDMKPTSDNQQAPVLSNWRQGYSCPPSL
jgi:hypothetical protein